MAGLEAAAAQLILEQAGFEDISAVEEASADVDEGDVIRTEPPEGTEITLDTPITIFVSTGPDLVAVPEVRCLSFNAAQNRLENAGLNAVISSDTVEINPACPLGNKVASQDPAPGTEVAPLTTVTLFAGQATVPTGPTGPTGTT